MRPGAAGSPTQHHPVSGEQQREDDRVAHQEDPEPEHELFGAFVGVAMRGTEIDPWVLLRPARSLLRLDQGMGRKPLIHRLDFLVSRNWAGCGHGSQPAKMMLFDLACRDDLLGVADKAPPDDGREGGETRQDHQPPDVPDQTKGDRARRSRRGSCPWRCFSASRYLRTCRGADRRVPLSLAAVKASRLVTWGRNAKLYSGGGAETDHSRLRPSHGSPAETRFCVALADRHPKLDEQAGEGQRERERRRRKATACKGR